MFLILLSFLGTLFKNVQSKPLKSGNVKVISTNVCLISLNLMINASIFGNSISPPFIDVPSLLHHVFALYFDYSSNNTFVRSFTKTEKNLFWNASCFTLRFNTHTKLEIPGRFFIANDMTECIRLIMLKNCVRGPENSEWTRDVIFFPIIKLCTKYNFVPVNFLGCLEGTYEQKKPLIFPFIDFNCFLWQICVNIKKIMVN